MKRSDLKEGTVFRGKSTGIFYKILPNGKGLYIYAFYDAEGRHSRGFEGYIHETESNKGFTLENYIINKRVAAFFPFKDFEVVTPITQS